MASNVDNIGHRHRDGEGGIVPEDWTIDLSRARFWFESIYEMMSRNSIVWEGYLGV